MMLLKRIFLLLAVLLCLTGCLESSFQLAEDSRLPMWFAVPDGVERGDYTVQMELYSTFSGSEVVIKLIKESELFHTEKHTITSDEQPSVRSSKLEIPPKGFPKGYPRYKVLTVNGITDVIELRKMEPVFYMSDDPAIWKELGVELQKQGSHQSRSRGQVLKHNIPSVIQ